MYPCKKSPVTKKTPKKQALVISLPIINGETQIVESSVHQTNPHCMFISIPRKFPSSDEKRRAPCQLRMSMCALLRNQT